MKKKKKQSKTRKWIGRLHLWLGLASGIIVFIVAVTGCIYVFHDEIRDLSSDWRKIEPREEAFVAPSLLQEKLKQIHPKADVSMVVYQNKERPAHIFTTLENEGYNFYFDPYTGELLHIQNLDEDFFLLVERIHMYLLLPEKIGRQVVGISTLIFVLMLISGVALWWPKQRKNLKNSLKIKWSARWRRVNIDWHKTTGIYIALLALVAALTGISFSYEWMHESFYIAGNLGKEHPEDFISIKTVPSETIYSENAIDLAFTKTRELMPQSGMYFLWEQGGENPIVSGAYPDALEFDHQTNFYFHPQSGQLLKKHFYEDKSNGLKLQEMSYGLHTGQYFGITGKITAFIISLFVAGLPVSGFMIWYGRNYKKKKKTISNVR